ncbi:MAG: V-type ATP synthase subunit A, partial [Fervidicoccaceae archaeon]
QSGRETPLRLYHTWPVRIPRPYLDKLEPTEPLITGLRIIDTLFPIAKGGTAAIPGGFGTGKTVTLHGLAQWSEAKVVIYIGCGERGNEMTEVLERFPEYKDPWTGRPLMERTILIANTSNMPVAAREASIYVGITMAEYYRDQGYDVLLVADSTSRWAEALREIAGRLEEMPAEEGYPSYLASRIAEFYERAGRVIAIGNPRRIGSVTLGGAVSPPGGDFTEPVTSHTRRFVRVFWALDTALAYSRHYPAINWLLSYSAYADTVSEWWKKNVDQRWPEDRKKALDILYRENEVREIVRLVGTEGLSESDKLVLFTARLIKEGFLKQNAFDPIDAFSDPRRQYKMLRSILTVHEAVQSIISQGLATVSEVESAISDQVAQLMRGRYTIPHDKPEEFDSIVNNIVEKLKSFNQSQSR